MLQSAGLLTSVATSHAPLELAATFRATGVAAATAGAGLLAVRIERVNLGRDHHLGITGGIVVNLDLDVDPCRGLCHLGRGDKGAPLADVDRAGLEQPDVPINAAARIPAR